MMHRIIHCFSSTNGALVAAAMVALFAFNDTSRAQTGGKKAPRAEASVSIGWAVQNESFRRYGLPGNTLFFRLREELGYSEKEDVTGLMRDLNGDGEAEFLLRSHDRQCGSLGCSYALIDGKTQRQLGSFQGSLVILREMQNGYPRIRVFRPAEDGWYAMLFYGFNVEYLAEESELIDRVAYNQFMRQTSPAP